MRIRKPNWPLLTGAGIAVLALGCAEQRELATGPEAGGAEAGYAEASLSQKLAQRDASVGSASAVAMSSANMLAPLTYLGDLANGVTVTGSVGPTSIFNSALWDYYRFCSGAGSTPTIDVHRTTFDMDPALTVFFGTSASTTGLGFFSSSQAGMTFVAFRDDNNGIPHGVGGAFADPRLSALGLPSTGLYTLAVYDFFGAGPAPQYEIHVAGLTSSLTISMTVDPTELWPPNHRMHLVADDISASSTCDPSPTLSVSVVSDEALNGRGDGNTDADWQVVNNSDGTFDVFVRAERSGRGDGRVYTITATATDAFGSTAVETGTVTVRHDRRK